MQSKAVTVDEYISGLPDIQKEPILKLRKAVTKNLPKGFLECMNYGMIGYVVPHKLYPSGYHCNPSLPLPFFNIAAQKNSINLYHMGIYADSSLFHWFVKEYMKLEIGKPDMGKSCIRFKKAELIPFELIGKLVQKITPQQWIELYEKSFRR